MKILIAEALAILFPQGQVLSLVTIRQPGLGAVEERRFSSVCLSKI